MNSGIGGTLSEEQQDDVAHSVRLLMEFGPPSVSSTVQKLAVPVIRKCASCGPKALVGR